MSELKKQTIYAVLNYIPLHSAPVGQRLGYLAVDLPMTEDPNGRLLRLPMFAGMWDDECAYVMSTVADYRELCS